MSNSPFRYPGGKFYARKLILARIVAHDKYCEPFCGGGSIFFAKDKATINILNDKDEELMNCYRWIRDDVESLISTLAGLEASKEVHSVIKASEPKTDLERAKRWYYLNRTSYSGIMRSENCYWGYRAGKSSPPENWPSHLREVSDKLQGVTLSNQDFSDVINGVDDDFFLFVDPPYFNADQGKFYACAFMPDDHARLADVLKVNSHRCKFLLTYDDSDEIINLYNWCQIEEAEWVYAISRTDDQKNNVKLKDGFRGKRSKGKEIFISNYHLSA